MKRENGIEVCFGSSLPSGYGHRKITVELWYENHMKLFHATTDNMSDYDEASRLEGDDKYNALYNLIEYKISDEVAEWIDECNTFYVIAWDNNGIVYYNGNSIIGTTILDNAKKFESEDEAEDYLINGDEFGEHCFVRGYIK